MTLQQPISVDVDLTANAAYIRYAPGKAATTLEVWSQDRVVADLNEAGHVIGIKVTLDCDVVEYARKFAFKRGLAFPATLVGDADHYASAED